MRALVRVEAILTQLVFEHSLRIRLKAETSGSGASSKDEIASAASDLSQTTPKEAESDNLIGKINNLVTIDIENITEARDFILICPLFISFRSSFVANNVTVWYGPIQLIFAVFFLYTLLGWRYVDRFVLTASDCTLAPLLEPFL